MDNTSISVIKHDSLIHGVNMKTDSNSFVVVDNVNQKLTLLQKELAYMASGVQKTISFVPLKDDVAMDAINVVNKIRVEKILLPKPPKPKPPRLPSLPSVGCQMRTTSKLVVVPGSCTEIRNLHGGASACQTRRVYTTACYFSATNSISVAEYNKRNDKLKKLDEYKEIKASRSSLTTEYKAKLEEWTNLPPQYEYIDHPYIERYIPNINDSSTNEWEYNISELSDNRIVSFVAYTESSGGAVGSFLVGYDEEPNVLLSANQILGEQNSLNEQYYYSDSRRSFVVDIPVKEGTEVIKIKYNKLGDNTQKSRAYIYGYTKSVDLSQHQSKFEYTPTEAVITYSFSSDNTPLEYDVDNGIMGSDTNDTSATLNSVSYCSVTMRYDAERYGKIKLIGEYYRDNAISGLWHKFNINLQDTITSNFGLYKETFIVNNIKYNQWKFMVAHYGRGTLGAVTGIKNVSIAYE